MDGQTGNQDAARHPLYTPLHLRHVTGAKYRKTNAALVLVGAACIVITLLWVNLANIFAGLHSYA